MTTLLAKEIFHPAKTSDIVTIFDKKPDSGLDLLTGFIIARYRHNPVNTVVHMLCFERKPASWKSRLDKILQDRVIFYDFWYDTFGWNDPTRLVDAATVSSKLKETFENPDPHLSSSDAHLVVFDSTSLILLTQPANQLCLLIAGFSHQLSEAAGRPLRTTVALLHHMDLLDVYSERALQAISTSTIKISSSTATRNGHDYSCVAYYHPRRETVFNQLERIIVEEGWNVRFEHAAQAKQLRRPAGNEVDPTASVSFNLRLTEEEKSARNNVKLPHTRGSGVIYYEPDEADDIDYEDPDE